MTQKNSCGRQVKDVVWAAAYLCVSWLFARSALSRCGHSMVTESQSFGPTLRERKSQPKVWVAHELTGPGINLFVFLCCLGQFVWHIEWMLARTFILSHLWTHRSFFFNSFYPHTVAVRDLWSCVWEKERKRNGESSFFSLTWPAITFPVFLCAGLSKKKEERLRTQRMSGVTRYAFCGWLQA